MSTARQDWVIMVRHGAYDIEGVREVRCTEIGAKRIARKMARTAGHGWVGVARKRLSSVAFDREIVVKP